MSEKRKLPIDRPCSACSAGDTEMEYHDHHPPFREPVSSPQATRPLDCGCECECNCGFCEHCQTHKRAAQPAAGTTPPIESDLRDAVMFLRLVLTRKDMDKLNYLKPKIADWLKRRGYEGSILRETE